MKYDLSEITDIIRDRRTIYPEEFSEREVQRDMVQHILTNATWAPTHGKTQPWRFVVYSSAGRKKLAAIIEDLYRNTGNPDDFNPSKLAKLIGRAEKSSVAVVMVMKRSLDSQIPELEEIEAVACATQNAMLTATAYGLGSFWSSPKFIYSEGCAAVFGFSANDKVLGIMYLGYPAIEWPKSHRKPLEYMSTWVDQ